ncbi:50S ribosomal protein L19 [Candidatus Peregrinibacteria bacterium]|nr:50S ribosomal protein L19 [Candidatus Peregrinibacteria bacterium]
MSILKEVQEIAVKKKRPIIRPGSTVRVHQKIKEGEKERVQVFEGLVIKINSGHGADKTFTVRKVVRGIGVEKIFPVYSSNIEKIEVRKKSKVRRAKLYYMRKRSGKSARLKETFISEKEMEKSIKKLAEQKAEEEVEKEGEEIIKSEKAPEESIKDESSSKEEVPKEEEPKEKPEEKKE